MSWSYTQSYCPGDISWRRFGGERELACMNRIGKRIAGDGCAFRRFHGIRVLNAPWSILA